MFTFSLSLHHVFDAFCWSRVHYAADLYSAGHVAHWRFALLMLSAVLSSDRATLDLMDLLVETVPLESR